MTELEQLIGYIEDQIEISRGYVFTAAREEKYLGIVRQAEIIKHLEYILMLIKNDDWRQND